MKEPENSLFTWKIDNFSLYNTEYVSDVFDVKGIKWYIRLLLLLLLLLFS